VYAFSLFPDKVTAERKGEYSASLGPELKFGETALKAGELGATLEYRKVFPVIQSYGVGEAYPYWEFKARESHPLQGSQFVFAVVAVPPGAAGAGIAVELVVTNETRFGPIRYGKPEMVSQGTYFTSPV
jgi:hypothetical protein